MRPVDQLQPDLRLAFVEAKRLEVLDHDVRVENAHHHLLAKGGRHGRQAHLHLSTGGAQGLDPAILGPPFLRQIHAPEDLDARGHRNHHRCRQLEDPVHHAVNPEAYRADIPARLQMDVAGALFEGELQQPIDDVYDVLVVRADVAALAQLQQLFEVDDLAGGVVALVLSVLGLAHRTGHPVEVHQEAMHIQWIGDHPANFPAQQMLQIRHPGSDERFAGGKHDFVVIHLDRQDLVTLSVGMADHVGHLAHVDLHRVELDVGQMGLPGQPLAEQFQGQLLARIGCMRQFQIGDKHQRVEVHLAAAAGAANLVGPFSGKHLIFDQRGHHPAQLDLLVGHKARGGGVLTGGAG